MMEKAIVPTPPLTTIYHPICTPSTTPLYPDRPSPLLTSARKPRCCRLRAVYIMYIIYVRVCVCASAREILAVQKGGGGGGGTE